jgi:hypothetical protein
MATAPDWGCGRAEPKSALQGAGGRLNPEEPEDAAELQLEPSESNAPPGFTPCGACGVWCSQRLSRPVSMCASPSLAASNAGAGEGEACEVAKYASG